MPTTFLPLPASPPSHTLIVCLDVHVCMPIARLGLIHNTIDVEFHLSRGGGGGGGACKFSRLGYDGCYVQVIMK